MKNQAIQLLSKAADYQPKYNVFYPVDGDLNELEDYSDHNNFCEDCYDEILLEIKKLNASNILLCESSPEKEDFCICDNCHEIIETSHLFTSQEFEHFLGLTDTEFMAALECPRSCYEMKKILEDGVWNATKREEQMRVQLANRILAKKK